MMKECWFAVYRNVDGKVWHGRYRDSVERLNEMLSCHPTTKLIQIVHVRMK